MKLDDILHEFVRTRQSHELSLAYRTRPDTVTPEEDERKFSLHDAGRCRRARFFKRLYGEKPDISALFAQEQQAILRAWVTMAATFCGYLLDSDCLLSDDHREGRCCLLLEDADGVSMATVHAMSSRDITRLTIAGEPDAHHVQEILTLYDALVLQKIGDPILDDGEDIDRLIVWYISREHWQVTREYNIATHRVSETQEEWKALCEAWTRQKLPRYHETWECETCPHVARCH